MRWIHWSILICCHKKLGGRLPAFKKSPPPTLLSLLACLCVLGLVSYPYHCSRAFWGAARVAPGCKCMIWWRGVSQVCGHPCCSESCFLLPPKTRRDPWAGSIILCTSNPILQPLFHIQRMLKQMKSSMQLTAEWLCACTCACVTWDTVEGGWAIGWEIPAQTQALQCERLWSAHRSLTLVRAQRCCIGNSSVVAALKMKKM